MSADDVASHAAFRDKYQLDGVRLLADPTHAACEAYGVWRNDPTWGWGVARQTFVVDENGRLLKHWPKVNPSGHAAEVLAALIA